jgi:hypothetical protein
MIKSINQKSDAIEIDLTGPEGNAFVLLGYASKFAKQLGLDSKAIQKDMMSSDYEHLVEVFDKHFGTFVTLYR